MCLGRTVWILHFFSKKVENDQIHNPWINQLSWRLQSSYWWMWIINLERKIKLQPWENAIIFGSQVKIWNSVFIIRVTLTDLWVFPEHQIHVSKQWYQEKRLCRLQTWRMEQSSTVNKSCRYHTNFVSTLRIAILYPVNLTCRRGTPPSGIYLQVPVLLSQNVLFKARSSFEQLLVNNSSIFSYIGYLSILDFESNK